jgi:hypothetical protein
MVTWHVSQGHMTVSQDHMTCITWHVSHDHMTVSHGHMTVSPGHMTFITWSFSAGIDLIWHVSHRSLDWLYYVFTFISNYSGYMGWDGCS